MENSKQFALNLTNEPSFAVDDYIIFPSNQGIVNQLGESMITASPLSILFGAQQSGKTHLAHLWQQQHAARFLPDPYLKVEEENVPELANIINQSPIIIDDIDQKPVCEKTIFHIINLAIQAKQPLLFTSRKPLMLWDVELPDLLSRLKAAKHIEILPPDDMLMEAILVKTFADKQIIVPDNVIAYILLRIDRSIEAVINLVSEVDRYALQQKKPVTRGMVAKIFETDLTTNSSE